MRHNLFQWFKPAAAAARVAPAEVMRLYPKMRWQVFEAAFMAYTMFYIVRNNFAPVSKELGVALHYDKAMIGNILAGTAIAYGLGKFVMGYLADRSDARKYVGTGLLMTAALNFLFGMTTNYSLHVLLWTMNGFAQGMGSGPCTRGLSHWYSARERGTVFGFWNVSHNVGGGIAGVLAAKCAELWGWPSAFFVPGTISVMGAGYLFWRMRDTPQAEGLPPVEEFKNDWPADRAQPSERELGFKEIFFAHILPNKMLWVLAIANMFVYIVRYSMVDWGPTYLKEVKGASLVKGGLSTTVIELAGALGMLSMGWLSDKLGGRRGRVSALAMLPLILAFAAIRVVPAGMLWLDLVLFAFIGFFVYVPVMFSGVMALDLSSKKAVGTATGFVGFFGYVGRVIQGKGLGWISQHHGWDLTLLTILICSIIATVLLACLWQLKPNQ